MKPSPKPTQAVDVEVGARVRLRRKLIGMSQDTLGKSIGVTFQQVQKYEKGTNRIGSSRLHQIARVLNTSVASLFGAEDGLDRSELDTENGMSFAMSKDEIALNKAYLMIKKPDTQKAVLDFISGLAETYIG